MAKDRINVSISMTREDLEVLDGWRDLMGFRSRQQAAEFYLFIGMMSMELLAGVPISPENFANALYTAIRGFVQTEMRPNIKESLENFERWRIAKIERQRAYTPMKRLN